MTGEIHDDSALCVSNNRSVFIHSTVDHTHDEIRLLRIERELSYDGLIQCRLEHASLPTPSLEKNSIQQQRPQPVPQYNALSYVWGEDKSNHTILINDYTHLVRHNLYLFLCQARRRFRARRIPIWIDAICINQDDVSERNHQVSRMRHIYEGAKEVFIWFGDWPVEGIPAWHESSWRPHQIPGLRWAVPFIRKAGQSLGKWPVTHADHLRCAFRVAKWSPSPLLRLLLRVNAIDRSTSAENDPEFFFGIGTARYWGRAWVVQECLLAKKKHVFIASEHMSWKTFQSQLLLVSSPRDGNSMRSFIDPRLDQKCTVLADYWHVFLNKSCALPRDQLYAFAAFSTNSTAFPIDYACSDLVAFLNSIFFVCYDYCTKKESKITKILDFAQAISYIVGMHHVEGHLSIQAESTAKLDFSGAHHLPMTKSSESSGLQRFLLDEYHLYRGPHLSLYGEKKIIPNKEEPDYHRLSSGLWWPPLHQDGHWLPSHKWLSMLGFREDDLFLPCHDRSYHSHAVAIVIRYCGDSEYVIVGRVGANIYDTDWACEMYSDTGLPGVVAWRVEKNWLDEQGTALWQIDYGLALQLVFTDLRAFVILFGLSAGFGDAETYSNWDRKTHYRETAIRAIAFDAHNFNYIPQKTISGTQQNGIISFDIEP